MRVLLLTYCFPPNNFPESILSSKTLGNIKDFEIDVLTVGGPIPFISSIDKFTEEYAKKKFKNIKYIDTPISFKIKSYLGLSYFYSNPDFFINLNDSIYEKTSKIISNYEILITWSQYHSIHIVGSRLKKNNNFFWLGHFSDPWTDNYLSKKNISKQVFSQNLVFESEALQNMNCISFTNNETKNLVFSKYKNDLNEKTIILSHVFDEDLHKYIKKTPNNKITIRYMGRFYSNRQPDPMIKTIDQILKNNSDLLNKIQIELIGISLLKNWRLFFVLRKYKLAKKIIKLKKWVNYEKSLELMKNTDGFLIIDAPAVQSVFFPSKLVEYISFKKPIFGITPPGTSHQIINEFGGWTADPQNLKEIEENFLKFINFTIQNNGKSFGNENLYNKYNAQNISSNFKNNILEKKLIFERDNNISSDVTHELNIDFETVQNFGIEWKKFNQDYIFENKEFKILFDNYFDIFPWSKINKNSIGFDLGCGSGRWAKNFSKHVKKLYCIDPSYEAILTAKQNLQNQNCEFINSTIENSNLPDNSMDFGYSLGVLHHVPDTLLALKIANKKLKKGAPFLLYLYYNFENRPLWYIKLWSISDVIRKFTSKLPRFYALNASFLIALFIYFPFAKISKLISILTKKSFNIPLFYYKDASFYTMRTDSLDRFGTQLEKRYDKKDILTMLEKSGFYKIKFSKKPPYWTCSAIKK